MFLAMSVNDVVVEEIASIPKLKNLHKELLEAFTYLKNYFAENSDSMSAWKDLYKSKEFQNGLHYT